MCVANTYEQIGRRPEYYWYFNSLQGYNKTKPIMSCMGNNDLLEKRYGQCFANFFTNENQWANSVYHYMVGNTEFICLNSNTEILSAYRK